MTSRRGFISGIGAVICAPAIVRASSLMKINSQLALPVRLSSFPPAPAAAVRIIGPIHIFADHISQIIFSQMMAGTLGMCHYPEPPK